MITVTADMFFETFDTINAVLFFDQLSYPDDVEIGDMENDYSYTYRDLEEPNEPIVMGINETFEKFEHFKYVLVLEMIRLYQYQVLNEEPSFNSLYSVFEYNAWKKFKDIEDPVDIGVEL